VLEYLAAEVLFLAVAFCFGFRFDEFRGDCFFKLGYQMVVFVCFNWVYFR
jgi:hypothetical protein